MAWKASLNPENGFIEVTYSSRVTMQDVSEANADILTFVQVESPLKFFVNIVDAELELSVIDLFKIPESWDALGFGRGNSMCVVTRESSNQTKDLSFLEDVSVNRGWNVKIFTNNKEAIQWLASQHPSKPS